MAAARAKLAELRALRASGKKRLTTYEIEDEGDIYDEVDEEGYKKLVRKRLDQDDFVIDDTGEGYADDGREEWNDSRRYYSDSDGDELPLKGKAAKRKREEDDQRKEKINNCISKYFNTGPAAKATSKPKPVASAEDEAFMADLLGEVDANPLPSRALPKKALKSDTRRKVHIISPPLSQETASKRTKGRKEHPSSPLVVPKAEVDLENNPAWLDAEDDGDILMSDTALSSPVVKAVQRKTTSDVKMEEEEEEELMIVEETTAHHEANAARVNITGKRPAPKIKEPTYPSPACSSPSRANDDGIDPSTWNDVTSKLNVLSSPAASDFKTFGKLAAPDAVEEDGSLLFFWLDYVEINGNLCLFGKVKNKKSGSYVSAFVKVDNILRKLYFLPRQYRVRHGRETEEEIDMEDVYKEVAELMSAAKVTKHKIKESVRKYAFELPDIPKQATYLKLMYSYDSSPLPVDVKGETFSHVFGTNTALFEQFVLWKNIMGPCWLKLENADFTAVNGASWCKLECQVSQPKLITVVPNSDSLESPRLTLMSLAFRTQLNVKDNKQEIVVASARVYENVSLTDTTPPEKLPCKTFTVMRPSGSAYPIGFEAETRKHRGTFMLEKSEQFLLSKFMALFEKMDPDVLMGHQLQEVDFNILLNRLSEKKTPGWHRIGRMKRSEWPKNLSRGASFFAERKLVAGRLLCDIANDMGKSLMVKCQSWSLTEMCQLYLGDGNTRRDIDNEVALKTWATSKEGLMNYISHCEADTYFIAALVLKLQMLPLTKVLTNLAGNSWARTLSGTRAERNEYILLHEFYRNKYICPDKCAGKYQQMSQANEEDEDGTGKKKKDKYKGGLVFEPERGLYDKYILVMDFNSLYPSIIQEFNICFTTVDRALVAENENEEKVPEVPTEQAPGILPRLIATLVNRRREVKKLMKDKRASPEDLALWDTKQMALKLTANSMYGCLGYTQSRFYARSLAMLTTSKGREILRSTKELAESNQLQVIYGDTDSVMINTNADNIEEALKVGNTFKRLVNERYKLLEIDIDNVFRRLLLHAKKKYAAINMTEVDGKYVDQLEVKGLDMKRREYCALSKEVSSKLLNEILSGDDPDVVLTKVHDYLRELTEKMKEFAIPVQKYVIYTKLSKGPDEYPNKETMPPAQVALRELARGKTVRPNDVISYIVTSGDSNTSSLPPAKRSYTLQDVIKPDSGLKPDVEYYLLKQIFPPIERLCAPIPGTDAVRLAECLGLDVRKYQINISNTRDQQNMEIFPLESQIPDSIRFKDASRLTLRCRFCHERTFFEGLSSSAEMCTANGLVCPNTACGKPFNIISIVAQLESQIRAQTAKYYEGWLVCDDPSCGNRTRQMSVYGRRCLGPRGRAEGCLGRMGFEYTEKQLYNQLLYYARLWDVDKAKVAADKEPDPEKREKIMVMVEWNRARFGTVKGVVDAYLKKFNYLLTTLIFTPLISMIWGRKTYPISIGNMAPKRVLLIAGSDSSGGAGLEADQRTLAVHGCYALTATTALTAQNTLGVQDIHIVPVDFVRKQINAGLEDVGADVVKLGMLASAETAEMVSEILLHHKVPAVVLDPVMVSTSGSKLLPPEATNIVRTKLLPLTTILTPNIPEAVFLLQSSREEVKNPENLEDAIGLTKQLHTLGPKYVLLKGGHLPLTSNSQKAVSDQQSSKVVDILYDGEEVTLFENDFLKTKNTHGTGCSLASAIAANLAKGLDVVRAVRAACRFVEAGIKTSVDMGKGSGPINHFHSVYSLPFAPYTIPYPKHAHQAHIILNIPPPLLRNVMIMNQSAQIVLHIQHEMNLHLDYCKSFGLSKEDIENCKESQACVAYSRYILDVGQSEDWLALQVAFLPCLIGYRAIAKRLHCDESSVRTGNKYWKWIENYVADDYTKAVETGSALLEKRMRDVSPSRVEELIKIFIRITELEISFWDMGLKGE
ncbi:phosphomethylpyrimidine kinase [Paracoccidioides brasiliensis Pb03]|nr:phosphomethylpyrimidine kinase [Paracoccidioides brasiliensis Pb03]